MNEKDFLVIYGINGHNSNISICMSISVGQDGLNNHYKKLNAILLEILKSHRLCNLKPDIFSTDDIAIKSICNI